MISYKGPALSTASNSSQVMILIEVVLCKPNINLIKANRTENKRLQMDKKIDQKLSLNLAIT